MKPPRLSLTPRSGPAAEAASQATPPCQGPPAHPLARQPAHFKPATPARAATVWRRGPQRAPARPGPRLDENEPNLEEPDTSTRLAKPTPTPGQANSHGQGQGDGNEPPRPPAATAPGQRRHPGADDVPLAPHEATPGRANARQFTEEVLALLDQASSPPRSTLQRALLCAVQTVLGRIEDPAAQAGGLAAVRSLLIDIPRTPRPHPAGTRGTDLHGLLPLLLLNLQRQRTPQQTRQAQARLEVLARTSR